MRRAVGGGAGRGTRTPRPSSAGRCCGIGGGASPAGGTRERRPARAIPPSAPRRSPSSKRPSTPLRRPKSEPFLFVCCRMRCWLPVAALCCTTVCTYALRVMCTELLMRFVLACSLSVSNILVIVTWIGLLCT